MNNLCVIFPFILLASFTDAQGYAPKYGYYPTQQGDWTLGSFNLVTQPTIVVWIKKDETVVDGFVVPREPKYYEKLSNRAKYVAKAICSFGNCRPVKRSQEVEVELITESKDNVHISVLPPGANPDGDLSQYITNTQYYPVRRTVGITSNYVPGFIEPLPKPKPFRRFLNRNKQFQTKKLHNERKAVQIDNTPKIVKVNGFEAPAILPRPKPRPNKKYIITKDGIKDIESKPKLPKVQRPKIVRRRKPSRDRSSIGNKKYDTVKVNGFEAPAILPRPTSRTKPKIITKPTYAQNEDSSRIFGARGLEAVPNRVPASSRRLVFFDQEELKSENQKHTIANNLHIEGTDFLQPSTLNFEYDDFYDSNQHNFVYNDFYV